MVFCPSWNGAKRPWLSLWESWLPRKGQTERVPRSNTSSQPSNIVPSQSACSADRSPKGRAKGTIPLPPKARTRYCVISSPISTIFSRNLSQRFSPRKNPSMLTFFNNIGFPQIIHNFFLVPPDFLPNSPVFPCVQFDEALWISFFIE